MLIYLLLRWCTSCSGKRQSRAETSAPSEVSRFCEFCAICGRTAVCLVCAFETSAPPKIASVQSVGVTLLRRRQDTSATIFRTQRICVNLCNLWEALLSSRFCEFRAICGRTAVCSVGALLALASGKAERRQVHPLKMHLCNLWEALLSSRFCVDLCNLWENIRTLTSVDSVDSVGEPSAGAVCVRSFLRSKGRRRRRIPARYTCVR